MNNVDIHNEIVELYNKYNDTTEHGLTLDQIMEHGSKDLIYSINKNYHVMLDCICEIIEEIELNES